MDMFKNYSYLLLSLSFLFGAKTFAENSQADNADAAKDDDVETVLVVGKREGSYTVVTEDTQKLVEMPGALGDPLGAITALPGVVTPANGGAPAVRGSSPEDNRYFVDGMPAGYIFHEFNTSIIDENVIQDFQLYSAGFSAEYADATGAIFDIRLRDPKQQDFTTTITASMLRTGVLLESQLTENSAFYLSARMGMLQFFLPEEDEPDDEGIRIVSAPEDSDYVFKYLWDNGGPQRLTINLMGASDEAAAEFSEVSELVAENPDFAGEAQIKNRFDSQSIVWNYRFHAGAELTLLVAHYLNNDRLRWGGANYFYDEKSDDVLFKTNLLVPLFDAHILNVGAEQKQIDRAYSFRSPLFVCTEFDTNCQDNRRDIISEVLEESFNQSTFFAIDQWQVTESFNVETGLQWHKNDYSDESFIHPRMSMGWALTDEIKLKASAGTYDRAPDTQYVLPEIGNPNLKSYRAQHYTLGLEGGISDNWNYNLELYRKNLSDLPLALAETEPDAEDIYANETDGEASGIELFINRNFADQWYGWMSLSYSESTRTNTRTNETSKYNLDTPVVFNLVGNYQFNSAWNAGFRFTLKSGEADTKIVGVKENPDFPDHYLPVYGEPFQDRLPVYARLDVRIERSLTWFGHEGSFFIDVINALNRENVSEITLDYEKVNETGELYLIRDADMGVFPSVGISFSF